jgi:succinate dehydrogenase/fumarate reductase cytochrome b subunit
MKLKQIHRISGIIIAAFLVLHLSNHLFALGGPALHIAVMKYFRIVYRFPPVEVLLLLCVAIQIVSGLRLVFSKGFRKLPLYAIAQAVSGIYLSLFLINHIAAVMLARYEWHVETDFYFASGVAVHYPEKLFFIPYYTLSVLCAFTHIACAHYARRTELAAVSIESGQGTRFKQEACWILGAGVAVTVLIMGSLTGLFYPL